MKNNNLSIAKLFWYIPHCHFNDLYSTENTQYEYFSVTYQLNGVYFANAHHTFFHFSQVCKCVISEAYVLACPGVVSWLISILASKRKSDNIQLYNENMQ